MSSSPSSMQDPSAAESMAEYLDVPFHRDLHAFAPSESFTRSIEINFARQFGLLGLASEGERLLVAVSDWRGWDQLDVVGRVLRRPVESIVTTPAALQQAINLAYEARTGQAQALLDTMDGESVAEELRLLEGRQDLLDTTGHSPVVKLVNLILFEAVKSRASDIHIQPYEDRVVARQRIDGVLFDTYEIPKHLQEEVLTRIKVIGRMDIAEKRMPQDGRATVEVGDRLIDLRIASLPTSHNERIVIRLLDKSARLYTLDEIGMPDETLRRFQKLIHLDHGLILVTGPTGSGKSTTLYAALQEINTVNQNVLTLEDPIEYQLDGISQTQINEKKGLTFASGLRSVLRQDPDIIMVGEIRDQETAVMAIQASLTGHLVFSTLHTNDAASAVTRLLDLGIEPYLVSSSLIAALAQRLVRKVCRQCNGIVTLDEAAQMVALTGHDLEVASRHETTHCARCRGTGYFGRVGLFELLVMDDRCRDVVQARGNASEVRKTATAAGMTLLRDDGRQKAEAGVTTMEEILRMS